MGVGSAKQTVVFAIAIAAVALTIGMVWRNCSTAARYAAAGVDIDVAVAHRLAQEASSRGPGKIVFVRLTGYIPATAKVQEIQRKGFEQGLHGDAWDIVELPPPGMEESAHVDWALQTSTGDWGRHLLDWMAPHRGAVAIVSMVGIPRLSPAQLQDLPPIYARVQIVEDYEHSLLQEGLVGGLATMKEDADPIAIRNFRGSPEELFEFAFDYKSPAGEGTEAP